MAEQSTIEWTDSTWNPITGCTLVSEGCRHCYAATLAATRLKNHPSRKGLARMNAAGEAKFTGEVRLNEQWLDQPLRWSRPRMIFVCAHGDLFHKAVPDEWIDRVFAVMALAPQHTFQVLTKRPERAREYLAADRRREINLEIYEKPKVLRRDITDAYWPLPNVWLGTSVEDQATADERIPHLLATPAAIRFVSAEPLLGHVDLRAYMPNCYECGDGCGTRLPRHPPVDRCVGCEAEYGPEHGALDYCPACGDTEWEPVCPDCGHYMVHHHPDTPCLDWVIVGGESGPKARPMHPAWARSLRDQCQAAGVAFHFKQWGQWRHQSQRVKTPYGIIEADEEFDWSDADERGLIHIWHDQGASIRLRKSHAGRLLDGREWNEVPR